MWLYNSLSMSANQGVSLSLRTKPTIHDFHNLLSIAMRLQVGFTYQVKLSHHLALSLSGFILYLQGIRSVTLTAHLLSLLLATCSAHSYLLSLMFLIMSITLLYLLINFVFFLFLRDPHDAFRLHLGSDQFLIRWIVPLQSHWHTFVWQDVVQLAECIQ